MHYPQRDYDFLRRMLRLAPGFMAVLRGPEHVFELTNDAYLQMVGHRDLIGLPVRDALPDIAGQGFYELLDRVYATGEPYIGRGIEIDLQRTPGAPLERAWLDFVYQPMLDEHGSVVGIFVQGHDVTDQKRAEAATRAATMRIDMALEAAGIGIWEADIRNGRLVRLSGDERTRELMGAFGDPDDGDFVPFSVAPENREALGAALKRALDPDTDTILDTDYRAGEGARLLPLRARIDHSATPPRLVGTVRDVTESRQAEERQAILRDELAHRIKNMLAVVSAIASQSFRGEATASMREVFKGRITALAEAQNILTADARKNASLETLVRRAVLPHAPADRFRISGPDVTLAAKHVGAFALAVHELATNSVKYGALSDDGGTVSITWQISTTETDQAECHWTWKEAGGPAVRPPERTGFGSGLISRALPAETGGTVRLEYSVSGVVCEATFPVAFPTAHLGEMTE